MAKMTVFWNHSDEGQRLHYGITPMPGRPMLLSSIGCQLVALAEALEASSRAFGPEHDDRCFLGGIDMAEDGTITFDIVVLPKLPDAQNPKTTAAGSGRLADG